MSSFQQRRLELAGQKTKARTRTRTHPGREVQEKSHSLDDVIFASSQARAYAEELGLGWDRFAKSLHTPSSVNGYTKSDVRNIAQEG